jgi:hypothetical protein
MAGLLLLVLAWRMDRRFYEVHMTLNSCATDPKDLTKVHLWRGGLVAAGLFLVFLVRRWLGRWVAKQAPREVLGSVVRVGLASLAAVVVCDFALRMVKKPPPPPPPFLDLPQEHYGDAILFRKYDALTTTRSPVGNHVTYAIDAWADRARHQEDVPDFDAPTILFPGESITVGLGLEYDETYVAMVEKDLGIQSINLAGEAFGADQMFMRLADAMPRFRRPVAVVTLLLNDEVRRIGETFRPRLALDRDGELVHVAGEPDALPDWLRRSPVLDVLKSAVPYHGDDALQVTRAVIRETARLARLRGAFPLFVFTNFLAPCLLDETGERSLVRELFEGQTDLPHLRVDLPLDGFMGFNSHPNAALQRTLATVIEGALRASLAASGSGAR